MLRALPMLRALAGRPQGLTTHDLAVTCAWDIPVQRDALQVAGHTMRQQERAGRVRRAGTAVSPSPRRQSVIRWQITAAGKRAAAGPGLVAADPAIGVLMAAYSAEQAKLDTMLSAALAEGTVFGDRMISLVAEELRQLGRKSAASGRLARVRNSGSAEAAAAAEADHGKVSAEADTVIGGGGARRREIISAATARFSAVSGQILRARDARDAAIAFTWRLPQRCEAAPVYYAPDLRKLALLRRGLAVLVKIDEGLEELEQVEEEMAALDRSLEQAAN
jgi:hypothetical protein